ncbi:Os07g0239667, partial [Oryza sativa Japonica Group]
MFLVQALSNMLRASSRLPHLAYMSTMADANGASNLYHSFSTQPCTCLPCSTIPTFAQAAATLVRVNRSAATPSRSILRKRSRASSSLPFWTYPATIVLQANVTQRRFIKKLHRPKDITGLYACTDGNVPGDGVSLGHCSEHPPGTLELATLGVHVKNSIAQHHVQMHPVPQHPPVDALAGLHIAHTGAAPDDGSKDERVRQKGCVEARGESSRAAAFLAAHITSSLAAGGAVEARERCDQGRAHGGDDGGAGARATRRMRAAAAAAAIARRKRSEAKKLARGARRGP